MKNLYPRARYRPTTAQLQSARSYTPRKYRVSCSVVFTLVVLFATACSTTPPQRSATTLAEGNQLYDYHCARCHGSDGKGDTHLTIKHLDGIGARYTLDEIIDMTRSTGNVDLSVLDDAELNALAEYVATL